MCTRAREFALMTSSDSVVRFPSIFFRFGSLSERATFPSEGILIDLMGRFISVRFVDASDKFSVDF